MPHLKDCSRYIVIVLIALLVAFSVASALTHKQPLENATVSQLDGIHGIGEVTAMAIVRYVDEHPNCTVEDLDEVPYVGEKKIEEIRKVFR